MIGSVSHGTGLVEDLIPTFASKLKELCGDDVMEKALAESCGALEFNQDASGYDLEVLQETLEDLTEALNGYAPPYFYFGANPGDGSDYGFWLEEDWQERAKEDDVLFVSDLSEVPDDFPFGGVVCHVNDHGNATLYRMDYAHAGSSLSQLKEVWAVV